MIHKILIVDDDPSILKLIMTLISREGFIGTTATGGREAIREMEDTRFDLVICDQTMPGLKGSEVAAWMRQSKMNMNTPFILLSAEQNPRHFAALMSEAQIDSFIPKPFSFVQILSHIRMMLSVARIGKTQPEPTEGAP